MQPDSHFQPTASENSDQAWTLEALQQLALANNPTLEQARALTWKAYGAYVQAGLYPNPTVGYLADEIGASGTAGQQGAFIEQEFLTAGKRGLNQNVAAREQQAAQAAMAAQEIRVKTAVEREFIAILAAERMRDLAKDLVTINGDSLEKTKSLKEPGLSTDLEIELAMIELEKAQIIQARAENEYQSAWERLTAVLGLSEVERRPLVGDLEKPPFDYTRSELWDRLALANPQIARAQFELAKAYAAVDAAKAQVCPNVTVQVMPMYDFETEEPMAGVQVGVPLPIFNKNQGNILAANADVVHASREIGRTEQRLRRAFASEYQQYATARAQAERYRTSIVPSAKRSLELSKQASDVGQFSYIQVLTVQRAYTEANQEYVQSLRDMWQSAASLQGLLLTDGLANPNSGVDMAP
ncbi:MAG: TolC family protein [Planctomycetaceae bacterium]